MYGLKQVIALSLGFFLLLFLSACSGGIQREEAQKYTEDFFAAVSEDDYEKAATLMHPDRGTSQELLQEFLEAIESDHDIDFSEGTVIEKYTGFTSALYNSDIGGASYTLTFQITIGASQWSGSTEVVRNDAGTGINNISVNPQNS